MRTSKEKQQTNEKKKIATAQGSKWKGRSNTHRQHLKGRKNSECLKLHRHWTGEQRKRRREQRKKKKKKLNKNNNGNH